MTTGPDTPKAEWIEDLPSGLPHKQLFAGFAHFDHEHEGFQEYEAAADPDRGRLETMRRSFRGQYLRRVRRLMSRERHRRINRAS